MSNFIEAAVTQHAEARLAQRAFLKRGLAAEQGQDWVTAESVFTSVRKAASRTKRKAKG